MAFIVSEGQIQLLDRAPAPMPGRVILAEGMASTYAALWRAQPQVRTVIGFLARNIAQIGLHAFERVSDTERRRLSTGPLADLLAKPNPRTSRYRFIEALVQDVGIFDNAILLKMKRSDGGLSLLRLPPDRVTPRGDSWAWPDEYRFKGARGYRDLKPEEVVHFRGYNPEDSRWGISPMESLRVILAEEWEASRWRSQMWRNGARASGWISRPVDAKWSPKARDQFKADLAEYTGGGARANGTMLLEEGMEFHEASITPKDAEYVATRKLTREEVAAAYHIPPPMVGILDHATFNNIEEQHRNLYQDTLGPWLEMIADDLALQLLPDFDPSGRVYVEFNLAAKMKGSFVEEATSFQTAVGAPWMTRNEARARQNLPAVPGGDQLVTPLNVLLGGQASPRDSAPKALPGAPKAIAPASKISTRLVARIKADPAEEHAATAAEVLRKFFRRQRAVVLSRLGAKAPGWWDEDRWNGELAADLFALAMKVTGEVAAAALDSLGVSPDEFDAERTTAFLRAVAKSRAALINDATLGQITDALGDLGEDETAADAAGGVFETAGSSRADQSGLTLATTLTTFAVAEAGKQVAPNRATKTWVTGGNPRPEHAAMDGETVGIDEQFSNGAAWPGDPVLGADGVANCNCSIVVEIS